VGARSWGGAVGVAVQLPVDGVADLAFERAQGFFLGLALGDLAVEVGATVGVGLADLADRREMQGVVQPSVAALGESVHDMAA
jgi:hypothetical protein